MLDDSRHVGDQGNAAVAHDRRAGEDADTLDRGVHRLDDDLLGAAHLIDNQPESAAGRPQDQDVLDTGRIGVGVAAWAARISAFVSGVNGAAGSARPSGARSAAAVAQPIDLGVEGLLDAAAHPGVQADGFFQLPLWDGIPLAARR